MNEIRTAEILAIGTELLMGQIINTNAAYLAVVLRDLGIDSKYQTVVGDNEGRILDAIDTALERSDLLLITGGLGPTEDDISMAVTAKALGLELDLHEASWARIQAYFRRIGRPLLESNKKQAYLPIGSEVLPNDNGTAPGAFIQAKRGDRDVFVALLPGPPSENSLMTERYLKPILEARSSRVILSRFLRLMGIGESQAEAKIRDLVHNQTDPTIAPYASQGEVMIRVTTSALRDDAALAEAEARLRHTIDLIEARLGNYIYHIGTESLYEVVAAKLMRRGQTLSVAESCTSGLLASYLGDIAGVSAVFLGGVIAYDNLVKEQLLDVPHDLLQEEGAVSRACAEAMAEGMRRRSGSDYAVAITGIAGPGGGSEEKPVGTIYLSVAGPNGTVTEHHLLNGNRRRIRENAALWSMNLLRRRLLEE